MHLLCLVVELCTPLPLPALSHCGQLVFRWVGLECLPVLSTEPLPASTPTPSSLFPLPPPCPASLPSLPPSCGKADVQDKGICDGETASLGRTGCSSVLCLGTWVQADALQSPSLGWTGDRGSGLTFSLGHSLALRAAAPPAASRPAGCSPQALGPGAHRPLGPLPRASSASETARRSPLIPPKGNSSPGSRGVGVGVLGFLFAQGFLIPTPSGCGKARAPAPRSFLERFGGSESPAVTAPRRSRNYPGSGEPQRDQRF